MKLIAFGLCVGAGLQAWRNFPADGPSTIGPAVLTMCVAVLCAYLGGRYAGRRLGGASATAVAVSSSEAAAAAHSTVNLAVVVPGQGAGSVPLGVQIPTDAAPWLAGPRVTPELDDLDGTDLLELGLIEDREQA